ncbi:hypothetical protein APHAL10511_007072 [Amanita phalloides]|nr:hypothetical protein APHAL10511_007072 [Amanita phalloides]
MSGLHSIATIIKRLEATTARLEDIAETIDKGQGKRAPRADPQILEAPSPSPTPPARSHAPPPLPVQLQIPASVQAYDNVLDACVTPFTVLTKSFASDGVISIVNLFESQMRGVRDLLLLNANCQMPSQEELLTLTEPLNRDVETIVNAKIENKNDRDWFSHFSLIAEAGPVVGWVLVPKPAPYVSDVKEAVDYYGNKIIKEWKEKDTKHVDWVRSFAKILDATKQYVQEHHRTGLAWNPKGVSIREYNKNKQELSTPVPPPAPPPPAPLAAASSSTTSVAAVFADLNRGEEVTKGLRKVDRSEMTHKNPSLRAGGTVPPVTPSAPGRKPIKPSKPQTLAGKKPSKCALEGGKWLIEYCENADPLTVDNVEISHIVNIYSCKNMIVTVKGKVNAVTLVNCTKTSVLVDSVVSSISVTRSPSFQLQVKGTVPMIQIDSTDSGQIYLSPESLETEITTAKCSAINVNLPVDGEEEGVFAEQALPEMLKTVVENGKLVTSIVEHVG